MRQSPFSPVVRQLPWVVGLAATMAVIGPFGSYLYMGLGLRLLYFEALGLTFWLLIVLLARGLARLGPANGLPLPLRMALAGLLAAIPGTGAVMIMHGWLVKPVPVDAAPAIFVDAAFLAVVVSIVIGLIVDWRVRTNADVERARVAALPAPPESNSAPGSTADFFRRIPPALGRELIALQMEDHYLRIHTAVGSDLILLRLRDALAELGPTIGRQVHRSWWVADKAVSSVERGDGRVVLVLKNGLKVPVSKSYRDEVKAAGWT